MIEDFPASTIVAMNRPSPLVAVAFGIVLVLACHAALVLGKVIPVLDHDVARSLTDSDGYTRLLRLQEWSGAGGWHDRRLYALGPPDGSYLHWGRAVDLLIWPFWKIASLVLDSGAALFWVGLVFAPVLHAALVPTLARACRSLPPSALWLLGPLLVTQRTLGADAFPGRPDHHVLLALIFGGALAVLAGSRDAAGALPKRGVIALALAVALALWASPEALLIAGMIGAVLAATWLAGSHAALDDWRRFSLFLAGFASLALLAERAPGDLLAREIDRLSIVHLAALFLIAAGLALLSRAPQGLVSNAKRRVVALTALGGTALTLLLALFPEILLGGYAHVGPEVRALLISVVPAENPLLPRSAREAIDFFIDLGLPLVVTPFVAWRLVVAPSARLATHAVALAFFLPLSMAISRFAMYAELAALVPAAEMGSLALAAAGAALRRRETPSAVAPKVKSLAAASAALALIASPWLIGIFLQHHYFPNLSYRQTRPCLYHDLADAAALRGGLPAGTILTENLFDGPEVAWKFGRPVVAGPYHRAHEQIVDWYRLLVSPVDDPELKQVMVYRQVATVLVCRANILGWRGLLSVNPDALVGRAITGQPPDWLNRVALPPDLDRKYLLYFVDRAALLRQ